MTITHHPRHDVKASHTLRIISALIGALTVTTAHADTVTWTGANGTSWQTAANWSSSPNLPAATDDVTIGSVPLVTFGGSGSPTTTVQSLASHALDFRLQTGSLSIQAASFLDKLTLTGGTLGGTGTISVASAVLGNATLKDSGVLLLASGGNHTINGSALLLDGQRLLRNAGTLTFDSGATVNLTVNLNTGGSQAGAGRIRNDGTVNFSTYLNRQSIFAASNNGAADNGSSAAFDNYGTLNKTGTGTVTFNVMFNNAGTMNLSADPTYGNTYGHFQLDRGSSHTNGSVLSGSGQIMFSGGDHQIAGGAAVTIAKLQTFGSATMTVQSGADFRPGLFAQNANAVTTIQPGATFAPTGFELGNGTVDFLAGSSALPAGTKFSGGTLRGTGTLTVDNAQVVSGIFKDAGTLVLQGATSFSGGGITIDSGRTLRNAGTATFDSGPNVNWTANLNPTGIAANSGRFENEGTLAFKTYLNRVNTIVAANNIASATFENKAGGVLTKTGDGSITMGVAATNGGTMDVSTGFSPYGINFYGGKFDHQSGGVLKGSGGVLLQVNGSTFRAGSSTTIENIYVWGATTIESGAAFDPGNLHVRAGHTVTRSGTDPLVWRTQLLQVDGSLALPQNASLIVQAGRLSGSGSIDMSNATSATQPAVAVRGATLSPGHNNATLGDLYAATLTIGGGLKLAANSNVEIDMLYQGGFLTNPVVAADKITVNGNAEINGTLTLDLGPNLEAKNLQGRSFVLLTSKQLTGTFRHIAGLGAWADYGYAVDYFDGADADSLIDSVRITFNAVALPAAPVPEPETWGLMLAGLAWLRWRTRSFGRQ